MDGVRGRDEVRDSQPRLDSVGRGQPIVLIVAQSGIDGEVAEFHGVGDVERVLIDIVLAAEEEGRASAGQVIRHDAGLQIRIRSVGRIQGEALIRVGHNTLCFQEKKYGGERCARLIGYEA